VGGWASIQARCRFWSDKKTKSLPSDMSWKHKIHKTRKCNNCDALQLEVTRHLRSSFSVLTMTRIPRLKSYNLYPFPIFNVFTADILYYAVILTFDLNVYGVLNVTWSNTVPKFSEIEQSAAEL